jgi:lysophospholipase L1-like esterase
MSWFLLFYFCPLKMTNLTDRLHPNAEGYKVIAAKVWPVIETLL